MYHSPASFKALFSPRNYFAEDIHAQELGATFETTWQLVGSASSISRPGQYLSTQLGNVPVIVRNFDGNLVALKNVCTHRHCSLVANSAGHSETLKCPYHGWEFGPDGRTRRIPAAKNFPDFDRERYRLDSYSLDQCGDLVFVRVANEGPVLQEWLGSLYSRLAEWTTAPQWRPSDSRTLAIPANWKIAVEASLESYHIPEVHPQSFAEDPGEAHSEHAFEKYSSTFYTSFSTPRLIDRLMAFYEKTALSIMGVSRNGRYEHHHVFPNLLISHTDSLTLIQSLRPVSSTSAITDVWQYGRRSVRKNLISRGTGILWGRLLTWISCQILKEDIRIFPNVQRGESGATQHAILGRCEERLFAFQTFVTDQLQAATRHPLTVNPPVTSDSCPCDNTAVNNIEAHE